MDLHTYISLGLIAIMLAGVWLIMRGLSIPVASKERRGVDFYRIYNEQEDRTETMFDRRVQ